MQVGQLIYITLLVGFPQSSPTTAGVCRKKIAAVVASFLMVVAVHIGVTAQGMEPNAVPMARVVGLVNLVWVVLAAAGHVGRHAAAVGGEAMVQLTE